MATKKQKRLAGERRQAEYLEESRQSGLRAQEADRARRASIAEGETRKTNAAKASKSIRKMAMKSESTPSA